MIRFVVLFTQRSGSSMLVQSLSSHPRVLCYGEALRRRSKQDYSYRAYRTANPLRRAGHLWFRARLVPHYIDWLYRPLPGKDAIGFKLSYRHVKKNPLAVAWLAAQNVNVVHLIRRNVLKTLVSQRTAWKRGQFHSETPLPGPTRIALSTETLLAELEQRQTQIETHRQRFQRGPYLEVFYEDFVADRDGQARRLLEFLDVHDIQPLSTSLVKINPDRLEDIVENYEEVAVALRDTEFARFLMI